MSSKESVALNDTETIESFLKSDNTTEFCTFISKFSIIGSTFQETSKLNNNDEPFIIATKCIPFADKNLPKFLQHKPTLLHLCAYYGACECLKLIITTSSIRSYINVVDGKGRTAAHFAAYGGQISTLMILEEYGFKLNQKDRKGKTPIYTAVKYNHPTLVNYLLVNRKTNDFNVFSNNIDNKNENNDDDEDDFNVLAQKLLHVAAESNSSMLIVNVLIQFAQKVELFDEHGISLFSKVIDNSNIEFLQILLDLFEQCIDSTGLFPLHHAAIADNSTIIQLLIDYGADTECLSVSCPRKKVRPGETPLITACRHGSFSGVLSLLEYDADFEATDENGQTALHHAAIKGRVDIAEILFDFGADPEVRDSSFMTPADLAYLKEKTEMLQFFKDINVEPEIESDFEFEFNESSKRQKKGKNSRASAIISNDDGYEKNQISNTDNLMIMTAK